MNALPVGRGEMRREGKRVAILAFGSMLAPALEAAQELNATVANMRFVKPVDRELVFRLATAHDLLVTIEENVVAGGAGSAVAEALAAQGLAGRHAACSGFPTISSSTAMRSSSSPIAVSTRQASHAAIRERSRQAGRRPGKAA